MVPVERKHRVLREEVQCHMMLKNIEATITIVGKRIHEMTKSRSQAFKSDPY
jgi:hypothetical protein